MLGWHPQSGRGVEGHGGKPRHHQGPKAGLLIRFSVAPKFVSSATPAHTEEDALELTPTQWHFCFQTQCSSTLTAALLKICGMEIDSKVQSSKRHAACKKNIFRTVFEHPHGHPAL